MIKNISKKLKITAIAVMFIGCLFALIYAVYLLTWGFYLGAVLVVVASGIFVVIGFSLFGLAKVIDNTEQIAKNTAPKQINENK